MYARKVKKICSVRGCKNTESFAIAKTKTEIGNVIICASCLAEALSSVDECRKEYDKKIEEAVSTPTALFYHPELKAVKAENEADKAVEGDGVSEVPEAEERLTEAENEATEASGVDTCEDTVKENAETTEEVSAVEEESIAEGFVCPECGKVFATEKGLKAHRKVHEKE